MTHQPDPLETLRQAKTILLVDWPDQRVPRALIGAGFTVFSYSPDGYSLAEIVDSLAGDEKGLAPRGAHEKGYLVFGRLEGSPAFVDILNVYRPEEEHQKIIDEHVLLLGAKVLWLQPPVASAQTCLLAVKKGLVFIEGADIAETALKI